MSLTEGAVTPYSTITPYATGFPTWIPEEDQERIQAYNTYEWMYWGNEEAFNLVFREEDGRPIYLPTPRTIVNTVSHFLLKGLSLDTPGNEKNQEFQDFFKAFLKREKFFSRFNIAKKAGVARGDWIFHITADPEAPEGERISLTTVDPGSYFPVYDEDDLDVRIGVRLVEQILDPEDDSKTILDVLEYWYDEDGIVWRQENLWEMEGWNNPERAQQIKVIHAAEPLPGEIRQIPVYHFPNDEWDGNPFGNSELRGYERVVEAINQSATDEDVALALTGLGVYATDAGRPVNDQGQEIPWTVFPGAVLEVPGATMFKRVEGISSITPMQEHMKGFKDSLFESAGITDVALGQIDTQVAESGIALAIKFLPMAAKVEQRDQSGLDILTQMWYDWKFWVQVYERKNFIDIDIVPTLGEKLPINRAKVIEELNNMLDRDVISKAEYRRRLKPLGYEFPQNIQEEILAEKAAFAAVAVQPADNQQDLPGPGGRKEGQGDTLPPEQQSDSNNTGKVNESHGTEIDPER